MSCSNKDTKPFDLQGHRGCRGLYPENTIPAFIHAIDLGVNTLEMDLAVTKDNQLVVSHEPYMSAEICLDSLGHQISEDSQLMYNIHKMTYNEVRLFDCGSKPHPRFPDQVKMSVSKPLFTEVLDTVKQYEKLKGIKPLKYNIEIKSLPQGDNLFHPVPSVFSDLAYQTILSSVDLNLVTIQSFDFRVLQYFHHIYPEIRLALLIENDLTIQQNLDSLGFQPDIYSCDFTLLSRESIQQLHSSGIDVIPWTVNDPADMKRLMDWGVDGLITDYPDRFNKLENE